MKFTTWACDRCGSRAERIESRPVGWRTLSLEAAEPHHRDLCTDCVATVTAVLASPEVARVAEDLPPEPEPDGLTVNEVAARLPVGGCRKLYRELAKRARSADAAVPLVELCTELGLSPQTSGAMQSGVRNAARGLNRGSTLDLIRTDRRPVKGYPNPSTWAWVPPTVHP